MWSRQIAFDIDHLLIRFPILDLLSTSTLPGPELLSLKQVADNLKIKWPWRPKSKQTFLLYEATRLWNETSLLEWDVDESKLSSTFFFLLPSASLGFQPWSARLAWFQRPPIPYATRVLRFPLLQYYDSTEKLLLPDLLCTSMICGRRVVNRQSCYKPTFWLNNFFTCQSPT